MLRRASTFVLTALLLAGCGGSDSTGEWETRSTSPGRTTYDVASAGFSIAVPESWRAISADDLAASDEWEAVIKDTPALGPYAEILQGPDSVVRFIAVDPNVRDEFATNLNVIVEELSADVTLDDYEQEFIAQLESLPSLLGGIEHRRVNLPGGRAVRTSYMLKLVTSGRTRTVSTLQYAFVGEGAAYTLTYATLPSVAGAYQDTFAQSARSFRLL